MSLRAGIERAVVATLTGNLYLLVATLVLATVSILVSWIPPRGHWVTGVARLWGRGLLAASWMRLRVRRQVARPRRLPPHHRRPTEEMESRPAVRR